jgi:hypothetical protein
MKMAKRDGAVAKLKKSQPRKSRYPRNLSVFINCPYDPDYAATFDGIVFATVCCGFVPRAAKDCERVSETRIVRIVDAIKSSKYSLHDLSRCRGEGADNLARFNMPLELGIAMSERFDQTKSADWHDWLVLVPPDNPVADYISDLAGYDPKRVDSGVDAVVPAVISWLYTREEAVVRTPNPSEVLAALPRFSERLEKLRRDWRGHEPWDKIVDSAVEIGTLEKLIPDPATGCATQSM